MNLHAYLLEVEFDSENKIRSIGNEGKNKNLKKVLDPDTFKTDIGDFRSLERISFSNPVSLDEPDIVQRSILSKLRNLSPKKGIIDLPFIIGGGYPFRKFIKYFTEPDLLRTLHFDHPSSLRGLPKNIIFKNLENVYINLDNEDKVIKLLKIASRSPKISSVICIIEQNDEISQLNEEVSDEWDDVIEKLFINGISLLPSHIARCHVELAYISFGEKYAKKDNVEIPQVTSMALNSIQDKLCYTFPRMHRMSLSGQAIETLNESIIRTITGLTVHIQFVMNTFCSTLDAMNSLRRLKITQEYMLAEDFYFKDVQDYAILMLKSEFFHLKYNESLENLELTLQKKYAHVESNMSSFIKSIINDPSGVFKILDFGDESLSEEKAAFKIMAFMGSIFFTLEKLKHLEFLHLDFTRCNCVYASPYLWKLLSTRYLVNGSQLKESLLVFPTVQKESFPDSLYKTKEYYESSGFGIIPKVPCMNIDTDGHSVLVLYGHGLARIEKTLSKSLVYSVGETIDPKFSWFDDDFKGWYTLDKPS